MSCKFQVGDVVIGNKYASNWYHLTKEGAICEVISTRRDDSITVKYEGNLYSVDPDCFDLYNPDRENNTDEWMSILQQ